MGYKRKKRAAGLALRRWSRQGAPEQGLRGRDPGERRHPARRGARTTGRSRVRGRRDGPGTRSRLVRGARGRAPGVREGLYGKERGRGGRGAGRSVGTPGSALGSGQRDAAPLWEPMLELGLLRALGRETSRGAGDEGLGAADLLLLASRAGECPRASPS